MSQPVNPAPRPGWPAVALLLVAVAHAPALDGAFIWDDEQLIRDNEYIKDLGNVGRAFTHDFWDVAAEAGGGAGRQANTYYRPLVTLSYMVDHALWGGEVRGYHLTNLALHLAVVLLVYTFCTRVVVAPPWWAMAVATLFGLHPSRGESVAWISGRTDVLMALFALGALLLLARGLERPGRRALYLTAGWLCLALAMLCKESAIGLVVVVPALDMLILSRDERGRLMRNVRTVHLPLLGAAALYLLLRFVLVERAGAEAGGGLDPGRYLLDIVLTAGHYAAAVVNPYQPSMQLGAHAALLSTDRTTFALGAAGLVLYPPALWLAWRARERAALPCLGLVVFAAFLAPVLNILPLNLQVLAAERNLYLPMLGVALLLAAPLVLQDAATRGRRLVALALTLLGLSWGGALFLRSLDFTDPLRFWTVELERSPDNPVVQRKLAHALDERGKGKAATALRVSAWRNLDRLGVHGAPRVPLFVRLLERTYIQLGPHAAAQKTALAKLVSQLRAGEGEVRLVVGRRALVINASDAAVKAALVPFEGALLTLEGTILSHLGGAADEDIRLLHRAVKLDPDRIPVRMNFAMALLRALDPAGAKAQAAAIVRLAGEQGRPPPGNLRATVQRGAALIGELWRMGFRGEARASRAALWKLAELHHLTGAAILVRQVLRLLVQRFPEDRRAWAALARDLAASGEGAEALRVLARARARFGDEPGLLGLERKIRSAGASRPPTGRATP